MVHKNTILRVLITLLLACSLTSIISGADESVFKEQKDSPDFITTRGIFPEAPRNNAPLLRAILV